jgi:hypothetical protein
MPWWLLARPASVTSHRSTRKTIRPWLEGLTPSRAPAGGPGSAVDPAAPMAEVQLRKEPAHDEVFIRLAMKDMGWPAMAPAADALEAWIREQRREPAGALRQGLIADQRTASPATLVCDLSVPLR